MRVSTQPHTWVYPTAYLGVAPREILPHLLHQRAAIRTGGRVLEQRDQVNRLVGAARLSSQEVRSKLNKHGQEA